MTIHTYAPKFVLQSPFFLMKDKVGKPVAIPKPMPHKQRRRWCLLVAVVSVAAFLAVITVVAYGLKTYVDEHHRSPESNGQDVGDPEVDETAAPSSFPSRPIPTLSPTLDRSVSTPNTPPALTTPPTFHPPSTQSPSALPEHSSPPSAGAFSTNIPSTFQPSQLLPTLPPTLDQSVLTPTAPPTLNPTSTQSPSLLSQQSLAPSGIASSTSLPSAFQSQTTFYAVADVPYNKNQAINLRKQMTTLKSDGDFLVHLGDIKKKYVPCTKEQFESSASIMLESPAPVFLTVGDNEYSDCEDPEEALEVWRQVFSDFDKKWNHTINVTRQEGRPENFSFVLRKTLFVGLNIVGGRVHNATEWSERLTEQLRWCVNLLDEHTRGESPDANGVVIFGHANPSDNHNPFFEPLNDYIENVTKHRIPMLYMGGDVHRWLYEPNFFDQESFLRIRLSGGTVDEPLRMNVDPTAFSKPEEAFQFTRTKNRNDKGK